MEYADLIFYNGNILTMDKSNPAVRAVAVKDGLIQAVGETEAVKQYSGPETEMFDLKGKTLLPGFIDSHVHFVQTGLNALGVDLGRCGSLGDVFRVLRDGAEKAEKDTFVRGICFDETMLAEGRFPTIQELDSIMPDKPLWICRVDSHSCAVNSKALELMDIDENTDGVEKDRSGKPTGVLRTRANFIARNTVMDTIPTAMRLKGMEIASQMALKAGITALNALEGGELFSDKDAEALHEFQDRLPIDTFLFYQITDVDRVLEKGLRRIGGCLILDGSFGSRTAALMEPYADDPSTSGVLYFSDEELERLVFRAHREGLQITFHALGDRAIEQLISVYEKAQRLYPRKDARHRIEHFEFPTLDHIKRAARLGVICSVQPAFEYFWGGGGMYGMRLGAERAAKTNPFRTIIDCGAMLVGGSDSDVTPMNPLLGIQGALTHSNPVHRITIQEALEMFTINGAYAVFEEDRRGSIERGKLGDFVVLSSNPIETPPEEIENIEVLYTIKEGKILYSKY